MVLSALPIATSPPTHWIIFRLFVQNMNVATAQDQGEGLKTGNGTSLATQMRTLVEQCEYAPPFCLTLLYPALITINHPFPIHS